MMKQLHVAIVEDNPADVFWLKAVLQDLDVIYTFTVATDGEEARDFILKHGKYHGFPPADLIFLDMNLPKFTGLEVLRQIPDSADLPVCILTSSQRERNLVEQHFFPRKVSYITKPIDREHLLECFRSHDNLRSFAEQVAKH
jgi:two-component system, chemotaxis family, response regulator Rcp1